jgi:hypothetical protein
MKLHLVNIWYKLPDGRNYNYVGMVNEVLNAENRAIVYPISIFKKKFGFELPFYSEIFIQ